MKIIQALGWYYPESFGGTEIYVRGLSQRLKSAGHEVLIAAPHRDCPVEQTYFHDGIPVYRYPVPRNLTRAEYQGRIPVRGTKRFHDWLARQQPDVVHIHSFVTGLGLAELEAAKAVGARVIVTIHTSSLGYICQRGTMMRWGKMLCDGVCNPTKCAACELQHRGMPKRLAQIVGTVPPKLSHIAGILPGALGTVLGMSSLIAHNQMKQRKMFEVIDKLVLLTQWALDVMVKNGAPSEKLVLNRLGVVRKRVPRKPGPDHQPTTLPITVGYLGRFDPIKGVYDLACAVASLPRSVPIRMEFRGPQEGIKRQRIVNELRSIVGSDPRVTFAPAVAWDKVPSVLANYDVVCCPSACLEGGPTVALEAFAVGTPVIGTRIGGLVEFIIDGLNGQLVPPGDWRALAKVLKEVACDSGRTIDRWRRALPPVRTMDDITTEYLAIYSET